MLIVRREQEIKVSSPNPMKFGLSPKIAASMHICFLLTNFIAICFPLWADLWITAYYSNCHWSVEVAKANVVSPKNVVLLMILQGISMFLLHCYKNILQKCTEVSV